MRKKRRASEKTAVMAEATRRSPMSLPPVRGVSHSSQIHWQQASPTLHPPGQVNQNQVTDFEILPYLYVGTTSTTGIGTVHDIQCFGSGSRFYQVSGSVSAFGIRIWIQAKYDPQKSKNVRNFMFWIDGCSLLWAEGFFSSLEVLYGGLGIGTDIAVFFSL
jgi:hypothetical protein